MDIEELRDFCLSLGGDVEEKMPFTAFKAAQAVLAFYVCGHIFCYFDIDHFEVISVKCQPERIPLLLEHCKGIVEPFNMSVKHWIGILPGMTDTLLVRELVENSYNLVKNKYCKMSKK